MVDSRPTLNDVNKIASEKVPYHMTTKIQDGPVKPIVKLLPLRITGRNEITQVNQMF